jgi:hypothetical protein
MGLVYLLLGTIIFLQLIIIFILLWVVTNSIVEVQWMLVNFNNKIINKIERL